MASVIGRFSTPRLLVGGTKRKKATKKRKATKRGQRNKLSRKSTKRK